MNAETQLFIGYGANGELYESYRVDNILGYRTEKEAEKAREKISTAIGLLNLDIARVERIADGRLYICIPELEAGDGATPGWYSICHDSPVRYEGTMAYRQNDFTTATVFETEDNLTMERRKAPVAFSGKVYLALLDDGKYYVCRPSDILNR